MCGDTYGFCSDFIPQERLSVKAACSCSSISLMEMFSNIIQNIVVAQSDPCMDRPSYNCESAHARNHLDSKLTEDFFYF